MTRLLYLWLFLAGLAVTLAVAAFEHSAGYMDADYYYAGGIRLAQGHGFSELVVWNYLDDPQGLPHPSHGYWYPLASMIAAAGMWLTRSTSYPAARLGFILISALVAPLTAALAFRLTRRADLAVTAGALALFPTYLTAFLPVTDNYGLYMVLGAGIFLLLDTGGKTRLLLAGLCAGLMSLARSDGLLWLAAGLLFISIYSARLPATPSGLPERRLGIVRGLALFIVGYAIIMVPWFTRNVEAWGTALAPGSGRALLLHGYADTFAYPASRLTQSYLLSAGWAALAAARWVALLANLNSTLTLQMSIFLLPFTLAGLWMLRRKTIVQVALVVWAGLLVAMSLLFPFAGPRGSFSHAGAALYPVWTAAAVTGLGATLAWAERRHWTALVARRNLVLFAFVALNALFSIYLVYTRVDLLDWDRFERVYAKVETKLASDGASANTAVIVIDPPAYFTATGRPAVVIPDEEPSSLLALAKEFDAGYLILEREHLGDAGFRQIYDVPGSDPSFRYVGQVEDARIYRILR